jgi:hypothetical protein
MHMIIFYSKISKNRISAIIENNRNQTIKLSFPAIR